MKDLEKAKDLAIAFAVQRKNRKKMAKGGQVTPDGEPKLEVIKESYRSPAEAEYMADHAVMMAEGGSIADRIRRKKMMMADGGEVDLSLNAKNNYNTMDDLDYDALRKENYSESAALDDLDYDTDMSIGHELDEDAPHDRVGAIRRKMRSKK